MFAGLLRVSAAMMFGAVLAAPPALRAQAPAEDAEDEEWSLVETAVRTDVAGRWAVAVDQVVLEWGPRHDIHAQEAGFAPELVGTGMNGQWVVRVQSVRGTVGVRVRAGVIASVATAARALRRGHVLQAEDIRFDQQIVWGPPAGSEDLAGAKHLAKAEADPYLAGWVVQTRVQTGALLVEPAVAPPSVVKSGENVSVSWSTGAIRLTLMGRAMGTARAGESVLVRLETGKRLRGIAEADGTITVSHPSPSEL